VGPSICQTPLVGCPASKCCFRALALAR
jgi:hypothetical protein